MNLSLPDSKRQAGIATVSYKRRKRFIKKGKNYDSAKRRNFMLRDAIFLTVFELMLHAARCKWRLCYMHPDQGK